MLCLRKFPVGKKFMDKRGGEYQDFPSKSFCLSAEKLRRGTLQFVTNLRVSIIFICLRELYHDFLSTFFRLTVPKTS